MVALAVSAFLAGLATSVGPCMAPRYLALAALVANTEARRRWAHVACFIAGLLLCYALLAVTATLIGTLAAFSQFVYVGLSLCFLSFGLRAIAISGRCAHRHLGDTSPAAALMSGGALGLVFSPCCSPIVGIVASTAAATNSPDVALVSVFGFALGHVAPLATIGLGTKLGERIRFGADFEGALGTIGGGLSVALACYYGILA